ncbi:MAG TPA: TlpA disulfide reductase family protein [Flavobacterium sp.]|nr:TlpA disulfide reductase family protein [Flavobacterium sp.]
MKQFIIALAFFCISVPALSQSSSKFNLNIGEQIPDITLVLSDSTELKLRSLRGKFIVFDFFSEGCIVCMTSLPKIKGLQEEFKGVIEFIMVGFPGENVRKVYERYAKHFNLNFRVSYDSVLFNSLNMEGFPRYLWMDNNSVIKAITNNTQVNSANIRQFLGGNLIGELERKEEGRPNFDKPFLVGNNGAPDSVFLFRSILFEWKKGMETFQPRSFHGKFRNFTFQGLRFSLASLYNLAFLGEDQWNEKHPYYGQVWVKPIFEIQDTSILKKYFGYSLTVPERKFTKNVLQRMLQQDLYRFFGFKVKEEIRPMPCWKLVATDSARKHLLSTKKVSKKEVTHVSLYWQFVTVEQLLAHLNVQLFYSREVLVDYTGINGPIDIKIDAVMKSIESVNESLSLSGLQLIRSSQLMKVIVVTDE